MKATRSPHITAGALDLRRLLLATTAGVLLWCSAPAHARIDVGLNSCGSAGPVVNGTIGVYAQLTQELSSANCYAYTSASQGPGYASALANAAMRTGDWSSGYLGATASAGFSESVTVTTIDGEEDELGAVTYRPLVSFTGTVSAVTGPDNIDHASAGISYTFSHLGGGVSGSLTGQAGEREQQTGTWGAARLPEVYALVGTTFTIGGSVQVSAGVDKLFAPGFTASASAAADFSHTLRWMGVEVVQVYDKNLNPVATPAGFRFGLIGQDSGFDYFNAAPLPVPEPATSTLMLAGGCLLAARRRRQR